ncbi:hypothetical protein [uncultured Arcanobacterium sp.]|uniref:hypothetical protein n=1 Tax=uncultured Arcanobacterium sp. TaxID=487520 RepID=UPI002615ECA6|nr:hypothetical protein [uncultured Arcanobacterium sp.]
MHTLYVIFSILAVVAAILIGAIVVTACIHMMRHRNEVPEEDLQGPVRSYIAEESDI